MKKSATRILSLVLVMVMFLSLGITPAAAAEARGGFDDEDVEITEPVAEEPAPEEGEDPAPAEEPETPAEELETPAEEPAPAEITYPAASFGVITESGLKVMIDAPEGAFPAGTELDVKELKTEEVQPLVDASAVSGNVYIAADISFYDATGVKTQPHLPVEVSITSAKANGIAEPKILHIDDQGNVDEIRQLPEDGQDAAQNTASVNGAKRANAKEERTIKFLASSFSVYAVIGTGKYARATVAFYGAKDTSTTPATYPMIDSMVVKEGDVLLGNGEREDGKSYLEDVIYDPGAGVVPDGFMFVGWTLTPNYNINTERWSIQKVREHIAAQTIYDEEEGAEPTYKFYAMFFEAYQFNYMDETGEVSVAAESEIVAGAGAVIDYTINKAYAPSSNTRTFLGWVVQSGAENIISATYEGTAITEENAEIVYLDETDTEGHILYKNETELKVKGNVVFQAYAPLGYWLIFVENAKGATYCAPQFVKQGETTKKPRDDADMARYGYTFDAWYKLKIDPETGEPYKIKDMAQDEDKNYIIGYLDDEGNYVVDTEHYEKFVFGGELTEQTEIYASWKPNATAPYTVIFWAEADEGAENPYNFLDSMVLENATVGNTIAQDGRVVWHAAGQNEGVAHYFTVNDTRYQSPASYTNSTPASDVKYLGLFAKEPEEAALNTKIKPDGTTVFNVYYDRITYNFRFYYMRQAANDSDGEYSITNQAANSPANMSGDWGVHGADAVTPDFPEETLKSVVSGSYRYFYYELQAKYGADVTGLWAREGKFGEFYATSKDSSASNWGDRNNPRIPDWGHIVSWVLMPGAYAKGNATQGGDATLKGTFDPIILNENMLGNLRDPDANYLTARWAPTHFNWRYRIYMECLEGETYSDPVTFNGKQYYLSDTLAVSSGNTNNGSNNNNQKAAPITGFKTPVKQLVTTGNPVTEDGTDYWYVNFYYERIAFNVIFNDGEYVDGDNKHLIGRSDQPLKDFGCPTQSVLYGQKLSTLSGITPKLPTTYVGDGYVFVGWYMDAGCKTPFVFDMEMPNYDITVYAKWVQVQYRVFLHPNVPESDKSLDWGSTSQKMNFRISSGGKLSAPTGLRDEYDFLGWYSDKELTKLFSPEAFVFNESNIRNQAEGESNEEYPYYYDKTTDMTDVMNKYGNIVPKGGTLDNGDPNKEDPYNSDLTGWDDDNDPETIGKERFWITKRFDIYADWREKTPGAKGIDLVYVFEDATLAAEGETPPVDSNKYLDKSDAVAQPAVKAKDGYQFRGWVVQKWDEASGKFVDDPDVQILNAGDTFKVYKANAHMTDVEYDENDKIIKAVYTIQVRAEFVPLGSAQPTHIYWYSNLYDQGGLDMDKDTFNHEGIDTSEEGKGWVLKYDDIGINVGQDIPGPNTYSYPGYTFLGWAKVEYESEAKRAAEPGPGANLTEDDLFLKWDDETKSYLYDANYDNSSAASWTAFDSQQVAADKNMPLQDLYAVWTGEFYIVHSGVDNGVAAAKEGEGAVAEIEKITVPITRANLSVENATTHELEYKGTYNLTKEITGGTLYGGYYVQGPKEAQADMATKLPDAADNKYAAYDGSNWTWSGMDTVRGDQIVPQAGATYYIKEVPADKYLQPYFHYTYHKDTGVISSGWLISDVDDLNYKETGFLVYENNKMVAKVTSTLSVTTLVGGYTIKITPQRAFAKQGVKSGWLTYATAIDKAAGVNPFGTGKQVMQYWVTKDGATVNGIAVRTYTDISKNTTIKATNSTTDSLIRW